MPFIALALIVAAALGGGVSVASQQALPGDALYGVKIEVNEQIQAALAFSEEARATVALGALERRLEEAEKLSAEGRLNADTFAIIEASFEEHAQRVAGHIAALQEKENFDAAADIAAKFEASLEAHAAILARLSAEGSASAKAELDKVIVKVRGLLQAVVSLRASTQAEADASASNNTNNNTEGSATGADASGNAGANAEANANLNASTSGSGASGSGGASGGVNVNVGY